MHLWPFRPAQQLYPFWLLSQTSLLLSPGLPPDVVVQNRQTGPQSRPGRKPSFPTRSPTSRLGASLRTQDPPQSSSTFPRQAPVFPRTSRSALFVHPHWLATFSSRLLSSRWATSNTAPVYPSHYRPPQKSPHRRLPTFYYLAPTPALQPPNIPLRTASAPSPVSLPRASSLLRPSTASQLYEAARRQLPPFRSSFTRAKLLFVAPPFSANRPPTTITVPGRSYILHILGPWTPTTFRL